MSCWSTRAPSATVLSCACGIGCESCGLSFASTGGAASSGCSAAWPSGSRGSCSRRTSSPTWSAGRTPTVSFRGSYTLQPQARQPLTSDSPLMRLTQTSHPSERIRIRCRHLCPSCAAATICAPIVSCPSRAAASVRATPHQSRARWLRLSRPACARSHCWARMSTRTLPTTSLRVPTARVLWTSWQRATSTGFATALPQRSLRLRVPFGSPDSLPD
mmetsp:Transcript_29496/g.90419  ORF Transcript_29496/g.90419 Transcript_29496/m.90419 type:complete len:217 (-) Transcript_29496:1186-1836(-)